MLTVLVLNGTTESLPLIIQGLLKLLGIYPFWYNWKSAVYGTPFN